MALPAATLIPAPEAPSLAFGHLTALQHSYLRTQLSKLGYPRALPNFAALARKLNRLRRAPDPHYASDLPSTVAPPQAPGYVWTAKDLAHWATLHFTSTASRLAGPTRLQRAVAAHWSTQLCKGTA